MKYIRAFFNFLGFLTFVTLIGAATFWFIGYQKNKVQTSKVTFRDLSMTPVKVEDVTTATDTHETFPDFQPISKPAAPDRLVQPRAMRPKPVAKPAAKPAKKPLKPAVKPVTYAKQSKPLARAEAKRTQSKKPARVRPERPIHSDLSPCTLTFRATDNGASPRTGRGIVNIAETSELEKATIRRLKAEKELQAAANQIRNPPVWKSGIIEFFSQNK